MDDPSRPHDSASAVPAAAAGQNAPRSDHLTELVTELSTGIKALETKIAEGKTTLMAASRQQKELQSDLTILKRVADDFSTSRDEVQKVLTDASRALDAVQDRIAALPAVERTRLEEALAEIDKNIAGKEEALRAAEQELASRSRKRTEAERATKERADSFGAALDRLSLMPDSLRRLGFPLSRLKDELASAADAGQDRKIFVLSVEMASLRNEIEALLADDALKTRVDSYVSARGALAEARQTHTDQSASVTEQEKTLAAVKKEAEKARSGRKEALKLLFLPPKDDAPAAPPV